MRWRTELKGMRVKQQAGGAEHTVHVRRRMGRWVY